MLRIPSELIENVVVILALLECPSAIAALSQTNKQLFDLIYRSPDHHLWREVFLTTYDDPRPSLQHIRRLCDKQSDPVDSFDWAFEYQRRVQCDKLVREEVALKRLVDAVDLLRERSRLTLEQDQTFAPSLLSVVKTLLSMIGTSTPFPSSPSSTLSPDISSLRNAPFCPSYIHHLALGTQEDLGSLNVHTLERYLDRGYPPQLTRTLFARMTIDVEGSPPFVPGLMSASYWDRSETARLFHKLVFLAGFRPIREPLQVTPISEPASASSEGDVEAADPLASVSQESETPIPFPSSKDQFIQARVLARRRVYDMRYLSRNRMWGPYLPVPRANSRGASSGAMGTRGAPGSEGGEGGDDEEGEWEDEDEDDDLDEDFLSMMMHIRGPDDTRMPLDPPIQPYELVPDYTWLASARISVEARLKDVPRVIVASLPDMYSSDGIVDALRHMHATRIGSSPGYWNAQRVQPKRDVADASKGKGKELEVEGWDWAGVTGIWRRCVCCRLQLSLDRFNEDFVSEACRVMPMALRISGYSRAPTPPSSTTNESLLPVIHLEGESIGTDTSLDDVRKVTGTVSVIGDGAIRWSMIFSVPGSDRPLWSSEGIQSGPPGSACGVLGMWTGAQHERRDPLGPFWMWKVA
ncbi:hypothetical protein BV22DRAFT_1105634 [Leucogyrophana mollusca]|uniref:Uncharacterized protein n=1 Tax=Leucogyrophana mollusca TaxID=85980 RepID=A0ACB8BEU1_9AGAM|nr:hypothetical protein BV22DRAFT_1105634 [Leucogyrophana mollusca]